jgi:hypothetical protein
MEPEQIIKKIEASIEILHKDFSQSHDYDNELDLHFAFYHILCQNIPYLFELGSFQDEEGFFKGRRIYVEYETSNKYRSKRGKNAGRFDIVIFGKEKVILQKDYPLIAIELKFNYKPATKHFQKDFIKLGDPINAITYPIFIYFDTDKFSNDYEDCFMKLKKNFPKVIIFYLSINKIKKY